MEALISRDEALALISTDLSSLCEKAAVLTREVHGDAFDMCAVVSVKGGRCSEDCAFCAQSRRAKEKVKSFSFLAPEEILAAAKKRDVPGIRHFGLVSVGRRITDAETDATCRAIERIRRETGLVPCISLGLLTDSQLLALKKAGAVRLHNNLETSRAHFARVCTSHTYDEKIDTIRRAKALGFEICSGGLFGIGETWEDRIDLALTLRELDVDSVPVNLLNPVKGTPMEHASPLSPEEVLRLTAVFRLLLPHAAIRLAAGRPYLPDTGLACFRAGANASITGDMLTVRGISMEEDLRNIRDLGYSPDRSAEDSGRTVSRVPASD